MTTTIWYAEYDSSSFTFRALGATEAEARINLEVAARRHSDQCGIDMEDWFTPNDAWVLLFHDGIIGYRDDYAMVRKPRVGKKIA